ncbi:MAG: FMN-binding negative transcriptional regulator [Planctomycetes bacterium]|nr:FMN-binding negative transcriptional regulator [Planctomycetota bacterium]
MYQCPNAQVDDQAKLLGLIHAHPFATVLTVQDGVPTADHIPLVAEIDAQSGRVALIGHVARVNPLWRATTALAVFHGPHAYISADWYAEPNTVPTWNYLAVHARGPLVVIDDDAGVSAALDRLAERMEPAATWRAGLAPEVAAGFRTAIVAFRIVVEDLRGLAKLSTHHPVARRQRTIAALRTSGQPDGPAIADAMAATLEERPQPPQD